MRKAILVVIFTFVLAILNGQELYIKTYGEPNNVPLIYLHGGPGYNSVNFEASTAERLSKEGYFVIVYDRRGEGRSAAAPAKFNFEESISDLLSIYERHNLTKANLLGHSFGGILATKFAEVHPEKVKSVLFVGAPVSLQQSFKNIIKRSREIYTEKGDSLNLYYLAMLGAMDKSSLEYSSYCFAHAMQNGFYSPKELSDEAKSIYAALGKDSAVVKYVSQMTYEGPKGFWKNEKYTSIELAESMKNLIMKGIPFYGMYGKEDGLYSPEQVAEFGLIAGENHLKYYDNCSHSVFVDQQSAFIDDLKAWIH